MTVRNFTSKAHLIDNFRPAELVASCRNDTIYVYTAWLEAIDTFRGEQLHEARVGLDAREEGRDNEYRRIVKELGHRKRWEVPMATNLSGIWINALEFGGNTINRVAFSGGEPHPSVFDVGELTNYALRLQSNNFPRVMVKVCSSRPMLVRLVVRGESTKNYRSARGMVGFMAGGLVARDVQ